MRKTKKMLALLLMVVLTTSTMLIGCGKEKKNSEPVTDATTENTNETTEEITSEATEVKELEEVELNWYFVGNGQQKDTALIEEKINEYIKPKINATIKLNCLDWDTYRQKIPVMFASDEPMDIVYTTYWIADYRVNAAKSAFVQLNGEDNLFDTYAPQTKAMFSDEFLSGAMVDGKLYAIPANKDKAQSQGFVYRKDLAEKYNIDMTQVKTWEDLMPILDIIKQNEKDFAPFIPKNMPIHDINVFDYLTGGTAPVVMFNDGSSMDKISNLYETEQFTKACNIAREMYTKGYIRSDVLTYTDVETDIAQGNGFCFYEQLKPGKAAELTAASQAGIEWDQVQITPAYITNNDSTGSMMAVCSKSKNPERALMFLEIFNTDPYVNNLVNFGIEELHYTKVSDNVIEPVKDAGYTMVGLNWIFGNQYINYLLPGEDVAKWDKMKAFNDEALPVASLGFSFNPDAVTSELAAIKTVTDEYEKPLLFGVVDVNEELPNVQSALKQAGIDAVLSEIQTQYDTWKTATK